MTVSDLCVLRTDVRAMETYDMLIMATSTWNSGNLPGNRFYSLVLDEDKQEDMTDDRIQEWVKLLKSQLMGREYINHGESDVYDDDNPGR